MKTCFKCGETKPLQDFYRHPRMADGHLNKCKDCTKRDTAARALRLSSNPEWMLSERQRHRQKARTARMLGLVERLSPEQQRDRDQKYTERHPERRAAQHAVGRAIRAGRLKKQPCEKCGRAQVQAHHDDYSRPLEVRWLCIPHHNEHHVQERERLLFQLTAQ